LKSLEERIKAKGKEVGYEACGIIEAAFFEEFLMQLEARNALFPHSDPIYDRLRNLANPKKTIPWAKSIIVCLRRYDKYKIPDQLEQFVGKSFLFDGRLSYTKEYAGNAAFEEFLQGLGFRTVQGVVPARWSAVKSGLGKFRNNNFLYTRHGSWNFIDTWVIDKQLEYETPIDNARYPCPESCNQCVKACPSGALTAPLTMDAARCVAHLSFAPGSFPSENLREKMGSWIYGCDACQNACPANSNIWHGKDAFPEPSPLEEMITLENIFSMDEETYRTKLQPRFWYISKDDFWQWKCNAIRAMANDDSIKYISYFTQALEDSNGNVREMAQWALNKAGEGGLAVK
jgi:epoxyqueuosine reductase